MASAGRVGDRKEITPISDMTDHELKSRYVECKNRYRVAKQNFEFEYAPMLREEMENIVSELKKRGVA